jgi:uncharacterized protein (DUF2147 family)
MTFRSSMVVAGVTVALAFGTVAANADPIGQWLDKDGTTIRVHHCGSALCGTIVGRTPRVDPETGKPWTDKHNPDAARRERPLAGVQVFIAMKPSGAGKWSGRLYDSDTGKSYSGHLIDGGRDSLRVEGCVMGMCGGENLKRAR